jgi:tricorn protease-like protein
MTVTSFKRGHPYYPERIRCDGTTITFYQAQSEIHLYEHDKNKPVKNGLTHRKYLELTNNLLFLF